MLAGLHALWHAFKASLLTIGGLAFLVLIARGISRGETPLRYGGIVYRAKSPISFWFFVVLSLLLGFAVLGAGISSF